MVYPITKRLLFPIYQLWLGKVRGVENIPKDGSFIIAANHLSYYDSSLLHSIIIPEIDRKIHCMVNNRYWNNKIAASILDWGGCFPIYVSGNSKKKNDKSFDKAFEYLKKKDPVQIYPEGLRSVDGKLQKGKTGIVRLALSAKTPILPIGIIGSNKVLPKGSFFLRFKRCAVNIGKPIYLDKYYKRKKTKKLFRQLTDKVMKEIAKLSGQEYNP